MGIRPIVSSCESPTENVSQFIDYRLQPLMKALPSYLKDTAELINQLKELIIEPDTLLVTIDVKSLYTCILHKEGIQACAEALENSNKPSSPPPLLNHPTINVTSMTSYFRTLLQNSIILSLPSTTTTY